MGEVYFMLFVLFVVTLVVLMDAMRFDQCGRKRRIYGRSHSCQCRHCRPIR